MRPDEPKALTNEDFADRMARLECCMDVEHVAVAVSGGPDSMALLCLTKSWAQSRGCRVTALTVDHGLRAESAAEAAQVAEWCLNSQIQHETLVWRGEKPTANVQSLARQARYGLLDAWCEMNDASALLLAHHLEDQAETVLMRLGRGSGVYGLAGMRAENGAPYPGAPVRARPLLDVSKARLTATLQAAGQAWIEDPSNQDTRSTRVRARSLWPALAAIGITPERVARTAANLARAADALEASTDSLFSGTVRVSPCGYATIDKSALRAAHDEIALRTLARVLMATNGSDYAPRLERLERLLARIRADNLAGGVTLGGCRIIPLVSDQTLLVVREARSMEGALPLKTGTQLWDGRFLVRGPGAGSPLHIDRLGRTGFATLRAACGEKAVKNIPAPARPVLPALFDKSGLLAVPTLEYWRDGAVEGQISVELLDRSKKWAGQPNA